MNLMNNFALSLVRILLSLFSGWLFLDKIINDFDWNTLLLWLIFTELFYTNTTTLVKDSNK